MRFSAGKKYLQNLYLQINRRSDKLIGVILLAISLLSYAIWSIHSWDNIFYLATLCYYIIITFFIVKVPVFSAVGMYNLYLFGYVQIGVLMQGLYTQFEPTVIYTIAFYNVTAPFLLLIWKRRKNTQNAFALKRVYISPKLSACLFYLGVACILAFFVWVGTIPMLAEDAENFRVDAVAGRGFLVVIANVCFDVSVLLTDNPKERFVKLCIAVLLLLGTGFRAPAMELVLVVFITYWVGKGKRFMAPALILAVLLCLAYALLGVFRSSSQWSWSSLYMPVLWRFYVNTNNFNTIFKLYPTELFQYGKAFINDLLVILPGSQQTYMTQLKDIMNFQFDGGSLTPSVFGEGYYNWGVAGAMLWPLATLLIVMLIDHANRTKIDARLYFLLSFATVGFSTNSMVPVLTGGYFPAVIVYVALVYLSKIRKRRIPSSLQ